MVWAKILVGGFALAVMAGAAAPAAGHSLEELEGKLKKGEKYLQVVHEAATGFTLKDAQGRSVSLADYRGKVVVLNFIYASCPDICPLHSERVAEIQEMIKPTPMRDIVQFITITTDPANDAPEAMKAYGPAHGLDPVNWVFLTSGQSQPAATRGIAGRYGLKFTRVKDGYLLHGLVTFLIDKSGNLRAKYHGLKFKPVNFVMHVNALTNDDH